MWWLIPIAAVALGKVIYDALSEEPVSERPRQKTVLESNLERLNSQLRDRNERKIAILGQPGAGKSSLLKGMTGGAVRPLPVIGTQTDATNWSEDAICPLLSFYQDCIFVDVPGYDTESHPTSTFLSHFPWDQFDAFVFVVRGKVHFADESIYEYVFRQNVRICIARSFSESLDNSERVFVKEDIINRFSVHEGIQIIFFSNRSGEGVSDAYCAVQ